jgi:hypothetical protein
MGRHGRHEISRRRDFSVQSALLSLLSLLSLLLSSLSSLRRETRFGGKSVQRCGRTWKTRTSAEVFWEKWSKTHVRAGAVGTLDKSRAISMVNA